MRKGLLAGSGRKGYYNALPRDPKIHSDSAMGIRQPQFKQTIPTIKPPLKDVAEFYPFLWKQNKGIFYRGTAGGEGLGYGALGDGIYVTWREGMAKAFADMSAMKTGKKPTITKYQLPKDLKLLDAQSATMATLKRGMGVEPNAKIGDKLFSKILTVDISRMGYDGVISDDAADGIVIFDPKKVKVLQ